MEDYLNPIEKREYEAQRNELAHREALAQQVEAELLKCGCRPVPREFGEIPNPLKQNNLTNSMAFQKNASDQLKSFLYRDAGIVRPNNIVAEAQANSAKHDARTKLLEETERLRQLNRQKLNVQENNIEGLPKLHQW